MKPCLKFNRKNKLWEGMEVLLVPRIYHRIPGVKIRREGEVTLLTHPPGFVCAEELRFGVVLAMCSL